LKARGVLAIVGVLALVVVSAVAGMELTNFEGRSYSTTVTVSTTRTVTLPGGQAVIEEKILRKEIANAICIVENTTATSILYFTATSNANSATTGNQLTIVTTTTESLSAVTVYENATIVNVSSGSSVTCTEVNPHYNVTSSCGPCA